MRYAVVIEKAGDIIRPMPDLPGCIATGATISDVEQELREAIRFHIEGLESVRSADIKQTREAIQFHIEGLKSDGLLVPPPSAVAEYVEA